MRGSPLWRAIIAFLLIASTGFPLWRLTQRAGANPPPVPAVTGMRVENKELSIAFTLTQAAPRLSIHHLGKRIWTGEAPDGRAEATLTIPWPEEGVDLRVQIEWPDDARTAAARIEVSTSDGAEYERSIWSDGPADRILTFR